MKNFLGRGSMLALAALLALSGTQAIAAKPKAEKAPSFKFSKQVQPLLAEAQKKQQANDPQGALESLDKADAIADRNDDDKYMIAMLRLNSAIALKDNAMIEKALEAALATGRVAPEEAAKFHQNLGAFAVQRNDFPKAIAEFQQVLQADPGNTELMVQMAELERRAGNAPAAVQYLDQAIKTKADAGEKADETWYRRALAIAFDKKLSPQTGDASVALLQAYPTPTNWRDALVIYRDSRKLDDQTNLDVMRLMRANGALTGEKDYIEFAETASLSGLPGEAKAVLDEGIAKGALNASTPMVKEMLGSIAPKVANDRKSLAGLEKESANSRNGKMAMGTADAYLGYGDYAKAAQLYKLALAKGGIDADTANTRLGFALGRSGDKAGAKAALDAVAGAPRKQLAQFYLLWLGSQA